MNNPAKDEDFFFLNKITQSDYRNTKTKERILETFGKKTVKITQNKKIREQLKSKIEQESKKICAVLLSDETYEKLDMEKLVQEVLEKMELT